MHQLGDDITACSNGLSFPRTHHEMVSEAISGMASVWLRFRQMSPQQSSSSTVLLNATMPTCSCFSPKNSAVEFNMDGRGSIDSSA